MKASRICDAEAQKNRPCLLPVKDGVISRGATLIHGTSPCALRNTVIFPATDVCVPSQNTQKRLLSLAAPSAVHLMHCVVPASQRPGSL